jgi:hypothetical protein
MRKLKWRIILSTANLLAVIAQSALGLRQYETFRRELMHSDAIVPYIPAAQLISYCINAPSFVFTNVLGNLPAWRTFWGGKGLGGYCFHDVSISFYLVLFCFWWCMGWRIDVNSEHSHNASASVLSDLIWVCVSIALVYFGLDVLRNSWSASDRVPGGCAVPISMVVWGLGLLTYFGTMLLSSKYRGQRDLPVIRPD